MKNIYRNGLMATALAVTALLPASCSQNDEPASPTGNAVQVELSAQIGSEKAGTVNSRALTRVADNKWQLNDMVGMYMIPDAGTLGAATSIYENSQYRIVEGTGLSGFKLTAASQEAAMYYPEDGSAINFIGYYPYQSTITGYVYPLDVKKQNGTVEHDLLYTNDKLSRTSSVAGDITFDHQLSKLNVKLKPAQKSLDLSSMTGKVTNIPATGKFSLIDAAITDLALGTIDVTTSYVEDSGDDYPVGDGGGDIMYTCFDIILIPHTGAGYASRQLNFFTLTKNYFWTLPTTVDFAPGNEYTIVLEISGNELNVTSFTIKAWGDGNTTLSIPMVQVPAGSFTMGSPDGATTTYDSVLADEDKDASADEQPMHQVTITNDFYMSQYEITNAQYCLFLNAKGVGSDRKLNSLELFSASASMAYASSKWTATSGKENYPMVYVTWNGAKAFADWVGAELPTEAQWEYACRGGDYFYGTAPYRWASFDNTNGALGNYAWYTTNSGTATHEVGKKMPNKYGLYDMHGNVAEWCADWYEAYTATAVTDPTGGATGTNNVYRGGAFDSSAINCRSAARGNALPTASAANIGFRVVY